MPQGDFTAEGLLSVWRGVRRGYAVVSGGVAVEVGEGEPPERPDVRALIMVDPINGHTHCADYGLEIPEGMSLEELVAPPDGLKHRYLRETPDSVLAQDMSRFSADSRSYGFSSFVDFREGGLQGCLTLRGAVPDAVILGRPVSPEFDPEEVSAILDVADGIGISSVSDMPADYIEAVADEVRERQKVFAIHVSERIREDIDFVLSLDPAFVVHMCEADDTDLLKCAEAEVPVVVCPRSNRYFGKVPPIARMQDLGVDIALGTDNGMICSPDPVAEMACFAEMADSQGGDPAGVLSAPFVLRGKLLNLFKQINRASSPGCISLVPMENGDPVGAIRAPSARGYGYARTGKRRNWNGF